MRPARCNLRLAAYFAAGHSTGSRTGRTRRRTGRSTSSRTQIAAHRPHGFYVCVRAIAFMFIHTQDASEIAGNSIALVSGNTEKVEICSTWCGLRQSMNRPLSSANTPQAISYGAGCPR